MAIEFSDKLRVYVTTISNEFIDNYMAAANGEYVKVYLYLLRHDTEDVDIEMIADALNHTESDVKRALHYWEKLGVLREKNETIEALEAMQEKASEESASAVIPQYRQSLLRQQLAQAQTQSLSGEPVAQPEQVLPQASQLYTVPVLEQQPDVEAVSSGVRQPYPMDKVNKLTKDEDFTQLLYIAQKYMNKVFTPRECEVFAYFYDGLHMSAELLEYLVEYCVQNGHTSMRYIETVGINWHEKRLKTVDDAKSYAAAFTKDSFAVMKAFGLTDRKPGTSEKEMIERWVKNYGFTKEVIVEACNRTMEAIHTPSFKYADKILSEWVKAGVKSLSDIRVLDQKRQTAPAVKEAPVRKAAASNQFHNFNQRDTDYDAMILQSINEQ